MEMLEAALALLCALGVGSLLWLLFGLLVRPARGREPWVVLPGRGPGEDLEAGLRQLAWPRSRQHFSKIQCNRDYNPKKKTVLAFAVGLHLSEDETIDLLKSAGYAFSDGSKRDWIVRYCLEHKIYNINQVNTLLFEYDQEQLGA